MPVVLLNIPSYLKVCEIRQCRFYLGSDSGRLTLIGESGQRMLISLTLSYPSGHRRGMILSLIPSISQISKAFDNSQSCNHYQLLLLLRIMKYC